MAQAFALSEGTGDELQESFVRAARRVVSAGADVVVPAKGILVGILRARENNSAGGPPVLDIRLCIDRARRYVSSTLRLRGGRDGPVSQLPEAALRCAGRYHARDQEK